MAAPTLKARAHSGPSYTSLLDSTVVDDEYPLVMVPGRVVAEVIHRLAEESFEGDVQALLDMALTEYPGAVTHRRPEEILGAG